jgi:hypothetical protein
MKELKKMYYDRSLYKICSSRFVEINQADADNFLEESVKNKVFPFVYEYIEKLGYPIDHKYKGIYREYLDARYETIAILKYIASQKDHYPLFFLLKGIGLEKYYINNTHRQITDLDICVKDSDNFWEIGKLLKDLGLDLYATMNLCSDEKGNLMGSGRFEHEYFNENFQGVELQITNFPVSTCSYITWETLTYNSEILDIEGININIPGPEAMFILLLGELLTRPAKMYLRDAIDVLSLFEDRVNDIDFEFICSKITSFELTPALQLLKRVFDKFCIPTYPCLERLFSQFNVSRVTSIVGSHIIPFLRRNSIKPTYDFFLYLIRNFTYNLNNHNKLLGFLKITDEVIGPMWFFNNRVYVYFMKVAEKSGTYQWFKIDHFHLLQTPIGTFVGCMHALYSDEELEYLRNKF